MLLCLESCSYNKSHPSPKAYCFSKIVDKKPFLVCFKSLLDSLSSTGMSSTPTMYTPWFASNIKPYHAGSTNIYPIALLELVCRSFQASTLHGVGPLPSHVVMISLVPSCMCHVWVSKGMLSWPCQRSIPFGSSYLNGGCHPWLWSLRMFFPIPSIRLKSLDQEDWVMKPKTSRVMKHNPTQQGAMSPMHDRKSCMKDWEVFLLRTISISSFPHDQCALHRSYAFHLSS
jgi:hypothetical protein